MCCPSSAANQGSPLAPHTGNNAPGCVTASCPLQVTVTIQLSQPVACPGHPLQIRAVGSPGGGSYAWTVSGDHMQLAGNSGDTVYLSGFKADDATGKIPEQNGKISVTYTHPNGVATDSKPVKIHKIDFEIDNTDIFSFGGTQVIEGSDGTMLGSPPGYTTIAMNPYVTIRLDPSCPRKSDCAANHRVGWIQNVTSQTRQIRFRDSLMECKLPLPIHDTDGSDAVFAWRAGITQTFTGDGDSRIAHHEDSPCTRTTWIDTRPGAADPPPGGNRQLRQIAFQEGFICWLAVQNIEWGLHDAAGSLAYQKNLTWSVSLTVTVDTSRPLGYRCTPGKGVVKCSPIADGKGSDTPVLGRIANDSMTWTTNPASPL
jgi:hypothetical protein